MSSIFGAASADEIKQVYEFQEHVRFRALKHESAIEKSTKVDGLDSFQYLPSNAERKKSSSGLSDVDLDVLANSDQHKKDMVTTRINRHFSHSDDAPSKKEFTKAEARMKKESKLITVDPSITDVSISVAIDPALAIGVALNGRISGAKTAKEVEAHDKFSKISLFALNVEKEKAIGGSLDGLNKLGGEAPDRESLKVFDMPMGNALNDADDRSKRLLGAVPRPKDVAYEELYAAKLPIKKEWEENVPKDKIYRMTGQSRDW